MARDGAFEPPSLLKVAGPDYLRFGAINAVRLFSEMTQSPTIRLLETIDTPVLLVAGSRDPLIAKRERLERLERLAPILSARGNVSVVWLNKAAHAINYSHPAELAAVIRPTCTIRRCGRNRCRRWRRYSRR